MINDRLVIPTYLTGYSTATTPVPENCGGSLPMKGVQLFYKLYQKE